MNTFYKPCCSLRCLVAGCKINEGGGCYCLCRMDGARSRFQALVEGYSIVNRTTEIQYDTKEAAQQAYDQLTEDEKRVHDEERRNAAESILRIQKALESATYKD